MKDLEAIDNLLKHQGLKDDLYLKPIVGLKNAVLTSLKQLVKPELIVFGLPGFETIIHQNSHISKRVFVLLTDHRLIISDQQKKVEKIGLLTIDSFEINQSKYIKDILASYYISFKLNDYIFKIGNGTKRNVECFYYYLTKYYNACREEDSKNPPQKEPDPDNSQKDNHKLEAIKHNTDGLNINEMFGDDFFKSN